MALTEQELQTMGQTSPQDAVQETPQKTQQEVPVVQSSTQIPNTFSIDGGRRQINLSALLAVAGKQNNIDKFVNSQARFKGRRQEIEQEIYTLLDELDSGKIKSRSAGKAYSVTQDVADPTGKKFDPRGLSLAYLDWIIDSLPQNFYVQQPQPEKPKPLPKYDINSFKNAFEFAYGISAEGPEQNRQWHLRDYDETNKVFTGQTQRLNQMRNLLNNLLTNYGGGKYDFSETGFRDEKTYKEQINKAITEIDKILDPNKVKEGEAPGDIEALIHLLTPLAGNYFTNPALLFAMPAPTEEKQETPSEAAARVAKEKKELRAAAEQYANNMMEAYGNDEIDAFMKTLTSAVLPHKNTKVSIQLPADYVVGDYDSQKRAYHTEGNYGNTKTNLEQNTKKIISQLQRMLKSDFADTKASWLNNDHLASFLRYYFTKNDTLKYLNKGKTWKNDEYGHWLWSEELCNPELGLFWIYNPANGQFMTASVNSGPEEAKALVRKHHSDKKRKGYYDDHISKNSKKRNGGTINNLRALRNGGIVKLETGNTISTFSNKDWREARAKDPMIRDTVGVQIADGVALVADLASLGLSFTNATGYGAIASGVTGAAGSLISFGSDWARDGLQWSDARKLGINLGLDVLGMIPGAGTGVKARKLAKVLPYFIGALGLSNLSSEGRKVVHKLEQNDWNFGVLDASDYLNLAQSIAVLIPGGQRVFENVVGAKYLNKIDTDPLKAAQKVDKARKSNDEAKKALDVLTKKQKTGGLNAEELAQKANLEKQISNYNKAFPGKATQHGSERIGWVNGTKNQDLSDDGVEAFEAIFGYKPLETVEEVVSTATKPKKKLGILETRKLRDNLTKKAGGDWSDVVELWEKKQGSLEDLDNIVTSISSKEGTYGAAFQKVKELLNDNKVPEYIVSTLIQSNRSGGKLEQLKKLKKGGIFKATLGANTDDWVYSEEWLDANTPGWRDHLTLTDGKLNVLMQDDGTVADIDWFTNNKFTFQPSEGGYQVSRPLDEPVIEAKRTTPTTTTKDVKTEGDGGDEGEGTDGFEEGLKTMRGIFRNPMTSEDDVLGGNKFKKVSPMWDVGQLANTIAGINKLKKQQIQNVRDNIYLPSNQVIQKPIFRSGFGEAQEYERQQELNYNMMSQNQTTDAATNKMAMLAAMSQNNNLAIERNALINKITDQSAQDIYEANLKQDALNYETAQERQKNLLAANKAIGDFESSAISGISDAVNKAFVQGKLNQQQRVTDYNAALKGVLDSTNATQYSESLRQLADERDALIAAANGDATKIEEAKKAYNDALARLQKQQEQRSLMQQAQLYPGIKIPGQTGVDTNVDPSVFTNPNPAPAVSPTSTETSTGTGTGTTDPVTSTVISDNTGAYEGLLAKGDYMEDILSGYAAQHNPYNYDYYAWYLKNGGKVDKKEVENMRFLSKQLESQARSREKGLDRLSKVTYKAILKSLGLK